MTSKCGCAAAKHLLDLIPVQSGLFLTQTIAGGRCASIQQLDIQQASEMLHPHEHKRGTRIFMAYRGRETPAACP